ARIRAGAWEARLALEIFGLDDQSISLPVAARVPLPLTNVQIRAAIHGDDASVVDHLGEDRDVVGSLEQLDIIVVGAWGHWRSGIQPHDATLLQRSVFPRVGVGTSKLIVARRCRAQGCSLLSVRCQGRKPAIGRIYNQ